MDFKKVMQTQHDLLDKHNQLVLKSSFLKKLLHAEKNQVKQQLTFLSQVFLQKAPSRESLLKIKQLFLTPSCLLESLGTFKQLLKEERTLMVLFKKTLYQLKKHSKTLLQGEKRFEPTLSFSPTHLTKHLPFAEAKLSSMISFMERMHCLRRYLLKEKHSFLKLRNLVKQTLRVKEDPKHFSKLLHHLQPLLLEKRKRLEDLTHLLASVQKPQTKEKKIEKKKSTHFLKNFHIFAHLSHLRKNSVKHKKQTLLKEKYLRELEQLSKTKDQSKFFAFLQTFFMQTLHLKKELTYEEFLEEFKHHHIKKQTKEQFALFLQSIQDVRFNHEVTWVEVSQAIQHLKKIIKSF